MFSTEGSFGYCFGRDIEVTEFCGKLGEFCENLGEFLGSQIIGWKDLTELAPQNSVSPQKNSLSSVFETVLPKTVFGPFLKIIVVRKKFEILFAIAFEISGAKL